jgi:carbon-monoxide dehydrogenase medium subunit
MPSVDHIWPVGTGERQGRDRILPGVLASPAGSTAVELRRPTSVEAALADLADLGPDGAPLAGATWIMRGALPRRAYVSLGALPELRGATVTADALVLGALTTHRELAGLHGAPEGLRQAAGRSAFPAVRAVATLGGNLATAGFPEADLVPALLAADATVTLAGAPDMPIAAYLAARPAGAIVTGVRVPLAAGRRSAYERLTVRGAGEYAVASVALSVDVEDGIVIAARVAVGAVEDVACLCQAAADALAGSALEADAAEAAGRAAAEELTGRDGHDAPGWYRTAVLPGMLRRAAAAIAEQAA